MDAAGIRNRRRSSGHRPLVVWQLADGKPGHESQSRGLITALSACREVTAIRIPVRRRPRDLWHLLTRRFPEGDGLPAPDLIVAAGHATHLPGLAARRAAGGRLIILMKPTLPLSWFDLCILPEHDLASSSRHVIRTRGVLNSVRSTGRKSPGRGLILIGGPSRHFQWSSSDVASQVDRLVMEEPTRLWLVTTSRRTPQDFVGRLARRSLPNLQVIPCENTGPGWLTTAISDVEVVFVTEDSVSMVYESLTSGGDVGLLRVTRRREGRISRGIDVLIRERLVIPIEDWQHDRFDRRVRQPLREADRCARYLCDHLLDAA